MTENELLKKIAIAKAKPDTLTDISPRDLADLVLVVLQYAKEINKQIIEGKIKGDKGADGADAYNPIPDVDYLSLPTAKAELKTFKEELTARILTDTQNALSRVKNGKNGQDAVVTEKHLKMAAEMACDLIELPDFRKYITEQPEAIRDSLELLQDDERLDVSAIKGLDELLKKYEGKKEMVVGGIRFMSQLADVYTSSLANNDVLKWNSTTLRWENGAGGGAGVSDGDKGDITVSGSGATWTIDTGLAATKIADGTVSNAEFQYLSNVTSDIQTQLNAKGNVTKVGTPVDNQVAVWTGDGTIEGDTNFTWDGTTHTILGTSLLSKTGTATVGTQTYNSNEYKLQGSQWFTSGSVAKTLTGGMTIKPRNPGAIVTSTLDFGYAIDSSTERPVISYKVGDHYNDGFAGQLTLRSGYWDGIGSFATGYGSAFGGMIETQYDGTFAFRPVGGSGTTFSGMRALSFGTHSTYASFWSRWGYAGGSNYGADIRTSFDGTVTIGAGLPDWHASAPAGASGSESLSVTIDQVITGNNASRPALRITKATEQLRIGYDASNYITTTIASTGRATYDITGSDKLFVWNQDMYQYGTGSTIFKMGESDAYPEGLELKYVTSTANSYIYGSRRLDILAGAGAESGTYNGIINFFPTGTGTVAIGGVSAGSAKLELTSTTEQLRIGYDASNYFSTTVASTGSTTFNLVGTSPEFTFSDAVNVPDEAYGAGWNGNTEVPTKNALYDKIETLGGGSGITRTVVTTSGSITLGAAASVDYTYYVAGAHTLSMPSPNTNRYTIKNLHSAAITVDTVGAENIEGAASLSLQPNDSIDVLSDGTNWYVH